MTADPFNSGLDTDRVLRLLGGTWNQADYNAYRRTKHWREKRQEALEAADGECALCGRRSKLQVHHKPQGYRALFREEVGKHMTVVCSTCHRRSHRR